MVRIMAVGCAAALVAGLAACGGAEPAAERPATETASDDGEAAARALARAQKKLEGACFTAAECDAAISQADLAEAGGMATEVFGASAFGPKSARAPSTYLKDLGAEPCAKAADECAVEWFTAYRAALIEALNEGDDSDSPPPIPSRDEQKTQALPYTDMELMQAGISFDTLNDVFDCRTAILTRRWMKAGQATRAEFEEVRRNCLRPVVMDRG
ncbi:hypothetical protein [Phenylobacterium sp.]|uniref:hypothetical protein n=1 Tax=Phenylobacterium sp. TaxID=1871053 RepID=UPI0035AEEC54